MKKSKNPPIQTEPQTTYPANMYMTIAEVKHYLNISQSSAYELSHRKDFPVCRFGSSIRIPREPFLAWVEKHTYIPTGLTG